MREPLVIQSRNNARIKEVAALSESKFRRKTGLFIVEGEHEVKTALQYGYPLESVFVLDSDVLTPFDAQLDPNTSTFVVSKSVFDKISLRQNPDGILAIGKQKAVGSIDTLICKDEPLLILDGLEKPGNHGAIIRSGAAFGIRNIILNEGSLDPHNPNVIRNSRAHSLAINHTIADHESTLRWLRQNNYQSFVASPDASYTIGDVPFNRKSALIVGAEHSGVSEFWKMNADQCFRIPTNSDVDSLNVSVSTAIALYELSKSI